MEKIRGFYPVWKWFLQERLLDEASQRGLQLKKANVFSVIYEYDDTKAFRHRIVACEAAKGSASALQFVLAWQREGWEKVCQRGKLLYFRCPAEKKVDEPGADDLFALLRRSIHRRRSTHHTARGTQTTTRNPNTSMGVMERLKRSTATWNPAMHQRLSAAKSSVSISRSSQFGRAFRVG